MCLSAPASIPQGFCDSEVRCSYRDGVPWFLYKEPVHLWEMGAGCHQQSLHFITLTLCCCSPPLCWSNSSLCPPPDRCLVLTTGRLRTLLSDQVMWWDCFPILICPEEADQIRRVSFRVGVCAYFLMWAYIHLQVCLCVYVWTINSGRLEMSFQDIFTTRGYCWSLHEMQQKQHKPVYCRCSWFIFPMIYTVTILHGLTSNMFLRVF